MHEIYFKFNHSTVQMQHQNDFKHIPHHDDGCGGGGGQAEGGGAHIDAALRLALQAVCVQTRRGENE